MIIYSAKHGIDNKDWKIYTTNTGRRDFLINLGIALFNYGIGVDWKGEKHPDYMHTGDFIPCDCKKCYFCINGHTGDIAHAGKKCAAPVVVVHECGTRVKTKRCAAEHVDLNMTGSSYCRMCYRNMDKCMEASENRKKANNSRWACPICK
jgi:hypothetical protein